MLFAVVSQQDRTMSEVVRILWFETWWSWSRPETEPYLWTDIACRGFNFVEAAAWFVFAGLVLCRWWRHRRASLELAYTLAFVLFGVSDLIEAWRLTSWLLWWKGANLLALCWLRRAVQRGHSPQARLF